jgi:Mg-chelatase subunit ChlD
MTELINALDNYTSLKIGENGHAEYGWSNSIQEQIVQLSFQITRTDDKTVENLSYTLERILSILKYKFETSSVAEKEVARGYLSTLYKMIGHTRDIIDGKGEYTLSYMMVYTWNKFYPVLAKFALKCFVLLDNVKDHQYGSWKDLKYFCEYCKNKGDSINSSLIKYCITLINEQLKNDMKSLSENLSGKISLVSKWVPREKSSFGWIYEALSTEYFSEFLQTANNDDKKKKAILKCKTEYRKLLSNLNRKIDTTQIKQCSNQWSNIKFDNVTSITLSKQKKAFLNITKNGEERSASIDRKQCAENFNAHIQKAVRGETEMKGKRVGMADFTKQAVELLHNENNQNERDLLNSQWRDNANQNGALGKMIAMVDVSGSMEGDPMNVAIALGIRIAEKSLLGKRVMTFSSNPTWVNLESYPDFVSQVEVIKDAQWGMNTNFYAALNMILDAIVKNNMSPEDVQDMVLVILSDMQIDAGDECDKVALYDTIKEKYEVAGIRVNGTPYKPPHILFWNLRSTEGFPTLSNQPNTSMMSGFSPSLLNLFCDKGLAALETCTPWNMLVQSLENERYKIMEDKLTDTLKDL